MTQYTELWNAVDPVAERIRSLGHAAPGSYGQFGKLSSIKDAPATPPAALDMVRILVEGHEAVARTARGRMLNAPAWKHLGLTPPATQVQLPLLNKI